MIMIVPILFLFLILFDFYILMFAFTQTRRCRPCHLALGLMLISFLILYLLKMDIALLPTTSPVLGTVKTVQNLSPVIYLIISLVIFIVSVTLLYNEYKYEKNTITRSSIKESIDNLPTGLSFSSDTGMILLSNRCMNQLCHEITGKELQDAEAFWNHITRNNTTMLQLKNGQTWSFSRSSILVNNKKRVQITATNITKLSKLQSQLKQKNFDFVKMNRRLRLYSEDLAYIKSKEERLATKNRLHNELGYILLATRKALINKWSKEKEKLILNLWKQNIDVLLSGINLKERNDFEELLQAASDIGIKLELKGELPQEGYIKDILIAATIETLNNAMRHAEATKLHLIIKETKREYTIEFINNGTPPKKEITEGGGLSALREKVQEKGGKIGYDIAPVFKLWITIPLGRGGDRDGKGINS